MESNPIIHPSGPLNILDEERGKETKAGGPDIMLKKGLGTGRPPFYGNNEPINDQLKNKDKLE